MARKIEIVPYDPDWPSLFQMEAEGIAATFGQEVVAIYHIGSTAIPNVSAKPIIDVLVEVQDIKRIDDFNEKMIERGYQPRGEFGIPGRRFLMQHTLLTGCG